MKSNSAEGTSKHPNDSIIYEGPEIHPQYESQKIDNTILQSVQSLYQERDETTQMKLITQDIKELLKDKEENES